MLGLPDDIRGCLFDLDGVLTQTADVHGAAWKEMFDDFLRQRADRGVQATQAGETFVAFDPVGDYRRYVDGRPRADGVRSFLASRGISLPEGNPADPPGAESVHTLGNRKNELVLERIRRDGVKVYDGSVRYVRAVRDAGLARAVVSASANTREVLRSTGLLDLFDLCVDGVVAVERGLRGKPAPDTFLAAAAEVGIEPRAGAVFEDALAGVEAGKAGDFGFVVGVDRVGQADALRERGADIVVNDLSELLELTVIIHPCFDLETWCVRETALDLGVLAEAESIFALANGHLGLRGNLDEGEPYGLPGTYLNGLYELRPLPYAEAGYGYPESGQTTINVTNGKLLRLLVDDEPFDVRYGRLESHERVLDLRAGTLTRDVVWVSPAGQAARIRSVRLVSFTHRAVAAISYEVEAIDDRARVVVQSELVANEPLPMPDEDPRVAAALTSPLVSEDHGTRGSSAVELAHRTAASGLRLAAAMDHVFDGPPITQVFAESEPDIGRVTVTTVLEPGQRLRIIKLLAYGWSSLRSRQALRDQVVAALTAAMHAGWDGLITEQRQYLDVFWERATVEVEGDPAIEQALRFNLFHVLQAGARAEGRAIPAKGLTGTGYDGHAFWDTESFVLPVLAYTFPDPVADALRWRQSILPIAKERARTLGLRGAAFPWRTIAGEECSAYWPAGTAAVHVNADIADAVVRYVEATGDVAFERDVGLELLVETARLWCSLGHHDRHGAFRIPGVTGPDEYSALADDNVYTNLMAQQNLRAAVAAAARHGEEAEALGLDEDERAAWRRAAENMFIPYDEDLGVHPQADAFTHLPRWDFEKTGPDQYPLFLHFPYFELYRKQVVKQSDLVLAMHLRGDAFTDEEKARNFAYYEPITVRDSSLSAATQAVLAAEIGHLDLAYEYLAESSLVDLQNLHANTGSGLHLAAMAGGWSALVAGFGGFRTSNGTVTFAPRVPATIARMAFHLWYRDRCLRVEATTRDATYTLRAGKPLEIVHHGEPLVLTTAESLTRPIPPRVPPPRPVQPPGRAPARQGR